MVSLLAIAGLAFGQDFSLRYLDGTEGRSFDFTTNPKERVEVYFDAPNTSTRAMLALFLMRTRACPENRDRLGDAVRLSGLVVLGAQDLTQMYGQVELHEFSQRYCRIGLFKVITTRKRERLFWEQPVQKINLI